MNASPIWEDILTERDRQLFAQSGHGARAGFGKRPVILIVDVIYNFVGNEREHILDSVKRWRNSCGYEGWEAVDEIAHLISTARGKRIPIIFTTSQAYRDDGFDSGRWKDKNHRRAEDWESHADFGNQIVAEIAPMACDLIIEKSKPSAFFGTQLASLLVNFGADSAIVCGTSTSGCVRATVVDAFSYNYRVAVVEECTFDRGQASHKVNLFDMHQKYADVVSLGETVEYLQGLDEGLFDAHMPSLLAPSIKTTEGHGRERGR